MLEDLFDQFLIFDENDDSHLTTALEADQGINLINEMSVVKEMCLWIRKELSPENPIHFSRFYPFYKLRSLPATPVSTPEKARSVALSCGLEYSHIRNIPGHEGVNVLCPKCKKMTIQPTGYMVGEVSLKGERCLLRETHLRNLGVNQREAREWFHITLFFY